VLPLITAEQRAPPAPAAGRHERTADFDDVVRAVIDELRVDAEHEPQGTLDLRLVIVPDAQGPHRALDQPLNLGDVVPVCRAHCEQFGVGHRTTFAPSLPLRYSARDS
jgi:hypothetical protein